MDWYKLIKLFYPKNWDIERVKDAVELNNITLEEYKEITNEDYIK
ncbi:XkdX family protein [Metaclostridioides mangenotii]|nr:XkdX family protein [Clostridioides mangenotii]